MTTQINTTKLTNTERHALHKCELTIEKGKNAFVEVGQALLQIRDDRLYREVGSFEDYCQMKWGFNRARGRQLIEHALTVTETREALKSDSEMDTMVSTMPERQTRELAKVPLADRPKVIEKASENGAVTAAKIAQAAKQVKKEEAPAEILDKTGFVIPANSPAMTHWNRASEVQELLTGLTRIKAQVVKAQEAKDKMYSELNFSHLVSDLTSAFGLMKSAMPFAVCPTCQGRALNPCRTCQSRGTVSEFFWKHAIPQETKDARAKAVAKRKDKQ